MAIRSRGKMTSRMPGTDPVAARLAQLSQQYANAPAFLTGSGETGLSRNDAQGYSRFLNDQAEFARLTDMAGGGSGRQDVRFGGMMNQPAATAFEPATGMDTSDAFGLDAGVSGAVLAGLKAQNPELYKQSQKLRRYRGY